MNDRRHWRWVAVSLTLLFIYLMFFHLCIGSETAVCIQLGITFWALWFAVCFCNRSVFKNRFEYLIHQLVGLDILIEGFNPIHKGYGFYLCALGFWALFLSYRFISFRRPAFGGTALQPEIADAGQPA